MSKEIKIVLKDLKKLPGSLSLENRLVLVNPEENQEKQQNIITENALTKNQEELFGFIRKRIEEACESGDYLQTCPVLRTAIEKAGLRNQLISGLEVSLDAITQPGHVPIDSKPGRIFRTSPGYAMPPSTLRQSLKHDENLGLRDSEEPEK